MIMRPGKPLLLPASPGFIWTSLLVALLFNMLLNLGFGGREAWVPDVLALTLVFWTVHQPLRVSVGTAFVFGLAMDVHTTALMGQHALAYTVLSFLAVSIHRRLLWFPVHVQALQLLPLFMASLGLELVTRLLSGGNFPGWLLLLAPVLTVALWPAATALLLAPQRRAHDPDENRPL
jgi:rod shape-determining protein MreD